MGSPWTAALIALLVWWSATGLILVVVKRADRRDGSAEAAETASAGAGPAHLRATLYGAPLGVAGALGLWASFSDPSLLGVYGAFLSAVLLWGWFELAFLCGLVTGPNMRPCPRGVPAWERFLRAWGTVAYIQMALTGATLTLLVAGWDAANPVGMWTFVVLFAARISAKLNLYLGVPKFNEEFLPLPMRHLPSHFRDAPMNAFFPIAATALTLVAAYWLLGVFGVVSLGALSGAAAAAGFALLAAMTALALVEHWMMVTPLPDAKLWRWMLPASPSHSEHSS